MKRLALLTCSAVASYCLFLGIGGGMAATTPFGWVWIGAWHPVIAAFVVSSHGIVGLLAAPKPTVCPNCKKLNARLSKATSEALALREAIIALDDEKKPR